MRFEVGAWKLAVGGLDSDFLQDLVDGVELLLCVGMPDVEHVQEQVGVNRFLEGGFEGGDEIVRQIADEADGVGEEHLGAALKIPGAGLGVEGGKELVIRISAGGGERVLAGRAGR